MGAAKGARASIECALRDATDADLCAELRRREMTDDEILDAAGIDIVGREREAADDGKAEAREELKNERLDALDSDRLCDAIAEGRLKDALEILHEAGFGNGLHPTTQMRLVELRRTA